MDYLHLCRGTIPSAKDIKNTEIKVNIDNFIVLKYNFIEKIPID